MRKNNIFLRDFVSRDLFPPSILSLPEIFSECELPHRLKIFPKRWDGN